jgi:aspartate aminotransferase
VITTGLSKNLALGGWRLGVTLVPDLGLRQRLLGAVSNIWTSPSGPIQQAAAYAFSEPPEIVEWVAKSRQLHAAILQAMASRFTAAGVQVPAPQAAFYLYPDFENVLGRGQLTAQTSDELAHLLLDKYGVGVVPGTAFGEPPQVLKVRVATSLLYGETDQQRQAALSSADPTGLPWIAAALDRTTQVLNELTTDTAHVR